MKFILLTIILLAAINKGTAQEQRETGITYKTLVSQLDQHPALEAVRQQVIEQREAAAGAGALPDPMVMLGLNNYPADGSGGFDRFAMTSKSIGFVQKIPSGGSRAASTAAKQQLSAKAQIAVAFTRQKLVAALNTALAGKKRVAQQQKWVDQEIKLLRQESAYWEGRLQAGESVLAERSRTEAALAQAEATLATLRAEQTQFEEELKRLVNGAGDVNVPDVVPLPWPNTHPLYPVLLAERDVQVARANVEAAEAAWGPNYQIGVTYAQRDNSGNFDGGDFISAQVGMSIPLWANRNQAPKLRSAQAGVSRAWAMLADTESQWKQRLAIQFAKIKETQATRRALTQKEKSIQIQISSLREAYAAEGGLDRLIAAKRDLLELKRALAALEARYVEQVSTYNATFQDLTMPKEDHISVNTVDQPSEAEQTKSQQSQREGNLS